MFETMDVCGVYFDYDFRFVWMIFRDIIQRVINDIQRIMKSQRVKGAPEND